MRSDSVFVFVVLHFGIFLTAYFFSFFFRVDLFSDYFKYKVVDLRQLWLAPLVSVLLLPVYRHYFQHFSVKLKSYRAHLQNLFLVSLMELGIISAFIFLFKDKDFPRSFAFVYLFSKLLLHIVVRQILPIVYHRFFKKYCEELGNVLLLESKCVRNSLRASLSDEDGVERIVEKIVLESDLPSVSHLENQIIQKVVDQVVFHGSLAELGARSELIAKVKELGAPLSIVVEDLDGESSSLLKAPNNGLQIDVNELRVGVVYVSFQQFVNLVFGVFGSILALLLLCFIYIPTRIQTKGSVLFTQVRVGKNGRTFKVYKIRTMSTIQQGLELEKANEMSGPIFKIDNDPRVTSLGKFLRKSSLDEFPQFFNVLKGDMAVIGPRPPIPSEVAQYSSVERKKLRIKPGITGLWQVDYRGKSLNFDDVLKGDVFYSLNRGVLLDLRIIVKTIWVMLNLKGR